MQHRRSKREANEKKQLYECEQIKTETEIIMLPAMEAKTKSINVRQLT